MSEKRANTDQVQSPVSKKRVRTAGTFNPDWTKNISKYIVKSFKGSTYTHCTLCNAHFTVSHGYANDVTRHIGGPTHKGHLKKVVNTPSISSVFKDNVNSGVDKVTKAEVHYTAFVTEHDLPFLISDHFTKLAPVMFPDSQIAKKFACGRQKTVNIINYAMGPECDKKLKQMCNKESFSIMVDESNDSSCNKLVAILVRVFDRVQGRIKTGFVGMPVCNIANANNLYQTIKKEFSTRQIPLGKCVGYMSDNANVMIGRHNSVLSKLREDQPNVYDLGCVCHLANTCLSYGLKKLTAGVEDLLIDIHFYFKKSSKRKEEYKEFLELADVVDPGKLIKHCPTRWLSLQDCTRRVLIHWPALVSYFTSQPDSEKVGSRVYRILGFLQNEVLLLTYHFLDFILVPMMDFNTTFQANAAMVGYLHLEMTRFTKKLLSKFVKMEHIRATSDILKVPYKEPANQHDNNLLAMGMSVRQYLDMHEDIDPAVKTKFFSTVRRFYEEVIEKIFAKFPWKDSTLRHLGFLNPVQRHTVAPTAVLELAERFQPCLNRDQLVEEFEDYCLAEDEELPTFKYGETPVEDFWFNMSRQIVEINGQLRFKSICELSFVCLSLPHSNADVERLFSKVRKIRGDYRGQLSVKTMHNLMSVKIISPIECFDYLVPEELSRAAKDACNAYGKDLQKSLIS